jgi:hypothetical protein
LVSANDWRRQGLWRQGICIPAYFAASTGWPYSLRGSNPRPMAHKTIALTTELRELLMKHSAHRQHDHVRPEPPTTAVLEDSFWPGQLVLPTSYICWGKSNGTRARAGLMAFPPCYRSHFSFRYKLGGLLRYAFLFCFVISFHSPAYHFGLAVQRRGITSTARSAAPQIWASMMSEPPVGIEPTTVRLRSACSAN